MENGSKQNQPFNLIKYNQKRNNKNKNKANIISIQNLQYILSMEFIHSFYNYAQN